MNPLKNLFSKVFESTTPVDQKADASKENGAFEWNPEEESVAPTSAQGNSWKRGGAADDVRPAQSLQPDREAGAVDSSLPSPVFEANIATPVAQVVAPSMQTSSQQTAKALWNEPAVAPTLAPQIPPQPAPVATPLPTAAFPRSDGTIVQPAWAKANPAETNPAIPVAVAPAPFAPAMVPLSDFEDVYRKAGIKSPVHGYGVERVYRLLTSRRLTGLDRSIRRSALLTALDAAGVPPSDVSQDAVLRRKALTAYEAEKALELQSLRSRNESRAEALQDTVETFTRQKQSQIERLAQGSTSAVRAQSDLEIRKRMEQDRIFRSLAYFVEPLPTPSAYSSQIPRPRDVIEIRPDTTENARTLAARENPIDVTPVVRPVQREEPREEPRQDPTPRSPAVDPPTIPEIRTPDFSAAAPAPVIRETPAGPTVNVVTPEPEDEAETRPMGQSGLEMALRAAAQEAKNAGWGQSAIVEDGATDTVDALRKLREANKTDTES